MTFLCVCAGIPISYYWNAKSFNPTDCFSKLTAFFYVCFVKYNAHIYPLIITNYFKCYSEILLILASRKNYCFIFK